MRRGAESLASGSRVVSCFFWFFKHIGGTPKNGVWNQESIGGGVEVSMSMVGGTFRTKSCLEHMDPATSSALSASDALRRAEETCFAAERSFGRFHAPALFSMDILLLHHFTSKVKEGLEKQLVKTWLVLCFFPHFPMHQPVGARESNPDPD